MRISDWSSEVCSSDLRHLAAKFVEDAGELVGDIAAACDDDPVRQGIEVKNLVRGDRMLAARKIGNKGPAAGRDQYAIGGQVLPVGQADLHRPDHGRETLEDSAHMIGERSGKSGVRGKRV